MMMNLGKASKLALLVLSGIIGGASGVQADENEVFLADPTIFSSNGKFYLTGTRNVDPEGFSLLESEDLKHWSYARPDMMILRKGGNSFGSTGFWAPQILEYNGGYLFAYTANEQCVLTSSPSIAGTYTQSVIEPIDGSEKNIDPFIFRDDDGRYYIYHVRFGGGNYLWCGEFDPATGKIVQGTLKKCFDNTQGWEHTGSFPSAPIMEGPTVIKLDGKYYLFYSANHYQSIDYAVGYAVADSPLGPWVKNENNPMISRNIVREKGSGHGDIFFDNEGKMRYVYHVHYDDNSANPRRTRIVTLNVDKSGGHPYKITADKESIIVPVMDSDYIPEVTSVEIIGSVVRKPVSLENKGNGIWSAEVNLDAPLSGEYINRNIKFRLNGDEALIMQRLTGTNTMQLTSDCNIHGEDIRINPGIYNVTLDLNNKTCKFDAEIDENRITVFGSSVANGQGATNFQGYAYRYGKLLETRFNKDRSPNPFAISNISIGGNTTASLLNRYSDMLNDFGKYVIIGLSMGNEGLHEASDKEAVFNRFRDNMLQLIEKVRSDGKIPVIMNNYTRSDYTSADYSYIRKINMLIHEWDVPSVNLLGAIDDGEGRWASGYSADNGHPNTEGHTELFYAMVPSLFDALCADKPQPERNMTHSLDVDSNHIITFKGEESLSSFTLSIRMKGPYTGQLISFESGRHGNYFGKVIAEEDGKITYDSPTKTDFTSRRVCLADDEWHDITLTHYYANGKTTLYVDNAVIGSTSETLVPGTFTIGNPDAEGNAKFAVSELSFWRSGMNGSEVNAIIDGKMLKSSLEIYSPMTLDGSEESLDNEGVLIANLAQSTNAVHYTGAGNSSVEAVEAYQDVTPVGFYLIDGTPIASVDSLKGIYIVKYDNGIVRKQIR